MADRSESKSSNSPWNVGRTRSASANFCHLQSLPRGGSLDGRAGEPPRIAIIGGGICGATCAYELTRLSQKSVRVTIFDRGRFPGGRCCHRRVRETGEENLEFCKEAEFIFDHAAQFFTAESQRFRETMLQDWLERGWASRWEPQCGILESSSRTREGRPVVDYWGLPYNNKVYTGTGGMSTIVSSMLGAAAARGAIFCTGMRVMSVHWNESGKWELQGHVGKAAYHDTKLEEVPMTLLDFGKFDAVILTTPLSTCRLKPPRGIQGIPVCFAQRVTTHIEVPLYSAMVAFEKPLGVDEDTFVAKDDTLWFAARTRSKVMQENVSKYDCWTLVSTPKFALEEFARVPLVDAVTGRRIPQDKLQVKMGPAEVMAEAFVRLLADNGRGAAPARTYLGGQRWCSAFARPGEAGHEAEGVAPTSPLRSSGGPSPNFVADDFCHLYAAGDYLTKEVRPGIENAAISGMDLAHHILATVEGVQVV